VLAAEHLVIERDAVTDDLAPAMRARRRQGVDGAFETIEHVFLRPLRNGEAVAILIAANFALHGISFTAKNCATAAHMPARGSNACARWTVRTRSMMRAGAGAGLTIRGRSVCKSQAHRNLERRFAVARAAHAFVT
jgi:hypothetical protein